MTLELLNKDDPKLSGANKEAASGGSFSPSEYLVGIVKNAVSAQHDVRISLPGKGDVIILPAHGEYHGNVPESGMEEFCQAPAALFKTTRLAPGDVAQLREASAAKRLRDLLWLAAFHASQGRLVQSRSSCEPVHEYDVIQFTRWPNLSRLPTTPNTMRIFALLTLRPSAIMLIHRKLRIPPREVHQVYSAACAAGFVNVISNHMGQAEIDKDEQLQAAPAPARSILGSLFAKIAGL